MKIANADVIMNSSRTYLERDEENVNLKVWVDRQSQQAGMDTVAISKKARSILEEACPDNDALELDAGLNREVTLKKLIAEILSGRKIHLLHMEKAHGKSCEVKEDKAAGGDDGRQGWGLEYNYEQTHLEKEDVSFNAQGVIRTADGREIDFALELNMSREFIERNSLNIKAGDAAIDPLVINFGGSAAELSDMRFSFDLDSDNVDEELPMLSQGSGFLAIDLNNDGIINNGGELFGPNTGNGFAELAAYDSDNNAWIDENDAVYERLRIMTIDSSGLSQLDTLQEKGIGAIYLGNRSTQFDLRLLGGNELLGQVQTTGIYVAEQGTVGTIQQLNLVV